MSAPSAAAAAPRASVSPQRNWSSAPQQQQRAVPRSYAAPSVRSGYAYRNNGYQNYAYHGGSAYHSYGHAYYSYHAPIHFYHPYYSFHPRYSVGFGLWVGYPVPYAYSYYDPYYYGDPYAYGYPSTVYPSGPYPAYPPTTVYPQGSPYPDGQPYPDSQYPPSSQYPQSQYPGSQYPPSQYPQSQYPQSQYPQTVPDPNSIGVQPGQSNTGGLSFDITPASAQVFVDGNYVGTVDQFTPSSQPLGLQAGRHKLEVRAQGYQNLSFDVNIVAGQVIPYQGSMERR
jgi:hypothetical protein